MGKVSNTGAGKKFRLSEAILTVICIVFVAEAAAPVSALGNTQYFWWIALITVYLLPYGLIAAELGTAYPGEGGLYDWVSMAFGEKWGTREAFYYWVNYPIWKASLAVMIPQVLGVMMGKEIAVIPALLIELAFIWLSVFASLFRVSDSKWILNGCGLIKVFLGLSVGCLGVYTAIKTGTVANPMTFESFVPKFDMKSLGYLAVIIFNFHGFEIIATMSDSMEHPSREIPKAIITGGLVIAFIYLFTAFGIGVAIPCDEISSSTGLIDSIKLMTGGSGGALLNIMAGLFLLTLFGNMIAWALGANSVAAYAAEKKAMPAVFASRTEKTGMPKGAAYMNGLVASIIVIVALVIPNEDLFWSFFALNLVMILLAYTLVFPAFLKLRRIDPDTNRPFRVPGGKGCAVAFALVPMILTLAAALLLVIPGDLSEATLLEVLPVTVGAVVFILIGEIIVKVTAGKRKKQ